MPPSFPPICTAAPAQELTSTTATPRLPTATVALMSDKLASTTLADFSQARDSQITFSVTHGWSACLEGPTMVSRTSDWRDELGRWLKPFLDRLGHKARRQMCPLYVSGLIGPGDRKSVQPMAKRLALGACDQLHH